jgi:hypothetical protein
VFAKVLSCVWLRFVRADAWLRRGHLLTPIHRLSLSRRKSPLSSWIEIG